jgi:hypothetical protein
MRRNLQGQTYDPEICLEVTVWTPDKKDRLSLHIIKGQRARTLKALLENPGGITRTEVIGPPWSLWNLPQYIHALRHEHQIFISSRLEPLAGRDGIGQQARYFLDETVTIRDITPKGKRA